MKTPYYTTAVHINPPHINIQSRDTNEMFIPVCFTVQHSRKMEGVFSNVVNTSALTLYWEAPKHSSELVFLKASFVCLNAIEVNPEGSIAEFLPPQFRVHFKISGDMSPEGVGRELLRHSAACHNTQFNYLRSFYVDDGLSFP